VILDPPHRDASPQPGPFVQRTDSSPGQPLGYQLPPDAFDRAKDALRASEQIRHNLLNKRHAVIGMHLIDGPNDYKVQPNIALDIYNYTDDLVLNVRVDLHDLQVTSIKQARYQPPLSPQELDCAIQLAAGNERIAGWLTSRRWAGWLTSRRWAGWLTSRRRMVLEATGIQVTLQGNDHDRLHRQVLVLFAPPNERSATYWSLVDLSSDTVREIGLVGGANHD
jgi:hypothetical protein